LSQNGTGADTGPNGMLSTGYITTAGMVKHFRQLVHVMDGYNVHAPCPHTPDHFHLECFVLHYEYQCTFSIMIRSKSNHHLNTLTRNIHVSVHLLPIATRQSSNRNGMLGSHSQYVGCGNNFFPKKPGRTRNVCTLCLHVRCFNYKNKG
jgi:hypothetical protein